MTDCNECHQYNKESLKKIATKVVINMIEMIKSVTEALGITEGIKTIKKAIENKIGKEKLVEVEVSGEKYYDMIELLKSDCFIKKFEEKIIKMSNKVKDNFASLKESLGKLQITSLLKQLDETKNCDDIMNAFMSVMKNKLNNVNGVLKSSVDTQLTQQGGGNYYKKYIKYKIKYYELKNL